MDMDIIFHIIHIIHITMLLFYFFSNMIYPISYINYPYLSKYDFSTLS